VITWLRLLLVAVALVAGVTERAAATDHTAAEVLVIESLDDGLVETEAPEPPRSITLVITTTDSPLPDSPAASPLFRPPRLPS
jgi:hypothetical protein